MTFVHLTKLDITSPVPTWKKNIYIATIINKKKTFSKPLHTALME